MGEALDRNCPDELVSFRFVSKMWLACLDPLSIFPLKRHSVDIQRDIQNCFKNEQMWVFFSDYLKMLNEHSELGHIQPDLRQ